MEERIQKIVSDASLCHEKGVGAKYKKSSNGHDDGIEPEFLISCKNLKTMFFYTVQQIEIDARYIHK